MTVLRREAQWLTWDAMSHSQREAFARILRAFADAVSMTDTLEKLSDRHPPEAFFEASPERANKTILVTGKRGTGKSSLLMALARATRQTESGGWESVFRRPPGLCSVAEVSC